MKVVFRQDRFIVELDERTNKYLFGFPCCSGHGQDNELYELVPEELKEFMNAVFNFVNLAQEVSSKKDDFPIKINVNDFHASKMVSKDKKYSFSSLLLIHEDGFILCTEKETQEYYIGKFHDLGPDSFFTYLPLRKELALQAIGNFHGIRKLVQKARERQYDQYLVVQPFPLRGDPC